MGLTEKQARFVREYLIDLNATQAAVRAGYSANTAHSAGQRLLKHPKVGEEIRTAHQQQSERVQLDADWVVQELRRVYDLAVTPESEEGRPNLQAALKALELLGRRAGAFERMVRLELPAIETAADTTAALSRIVQAVGRGDLSPTEAQSLSALVEIVRRNLETVDLERRLAALEARGEGA